MLFKSRIDDNNKKLTNKHKLLLPVIVYGLFILNPAEVGASVGEMGANLVAQILNAANKAKEADKKQENAVNQVGSVSTLDISPSNQSDNQQLVNNAEINQQNVNDAQLTLPVANQASTTEPIILDVQMQKDAAVEQSNTQDTQLKTDSSNILSSLQNSEIPVVAQANNQQILMQDGVGNAAMQSQIEQQATSSNMPVVGDGQLGLISENGKVLPFKNVNDLGEINEGWFYYVPKLQDFLQNNVDENGVLTIPEPSSENPINTDSNSNASNSTSTSNDSQQNDPGAPKAQEQNSATQESGSSTDDSSANQSEIKEEKSEDGSGDKDSSAKNESEQQKNESEQQKLEEGKQQDSKVEDNPNAELGGETAQQGDKADNSTAVEGEEKGEPANNPIENNTGQDQKFGAVTITADGKIKIERPVIIEVQ